MSDSDEDCGSVLHSGVLKKKSRYLRRWQERFFVLTSSGHLHYNTPPKNANNRYCNNPELQIQKLISEMDTTKTKTLLRLGPASMVFKVLLPGTALVVIELGGIGALSPVTHAGGAGSLNRFELEAPSPHDAAVWETAIGEVLMNMAGVAHVSLHRHPPLPPPPPTIMARSYVGGVEEEKRELSVQQPPGGGEGFPCGFSRRLGFRTDDGREAVVAHSSPGGGGGESGWYISDDGQTHALLVLSEGIWTVVEEERADALPTGGLVVPPAVAAGNAQFPTLAQQVSSAVAAASQVCFPPPPSPRAAGGVVDEEVATTATLFESRGGSSALTDHERPVNRRAVQNNGVSVSSGETKLDDSHPEEDDEEDEPLVLNRRVKAYLRTD